jgi:hypothetical protein
MATLFIANRSKHGGDVQMRVYRWRDAVAALYRGHPQGPMLAQRLSAEMDGHDAADVVRVTLTAAEIAILERVTT